MSKYIDAEKLKVEIERLKQENKVSDDKEYAQYELDVACGYDMACEEIVSVVNSLPQEQLEIKSYIEKLLKEKRVVVIECSATDERKVAALSVIDFLIDKIESL